MNTRPQALVFDVNETLLDLSSVERAFQTTFANDYAFRYWFSLLLHYSLVDTVTNQYHDFKQIGGAVLSMTEAYLDKPLSATERQALLQQMTQVRPHPEVETALNTLRGAGFRLFALTNSARETLSKQLHETGLATYFEKTWTVDEVRRYKPHPNTYQLVLAHLQLAPADTMLIAAHGWDIAGAARVGMQTGFISRRGQSLFPLAPAPTLIGENLADLARQLITQETAG